MWNVARTAQDRRQRTAEDSRGQQRTAEDSRGHVSKTTRRLRGRQRRIGRVEVSHSTTIKCDLFLFICTWNNQHCPLRRSIPIMASLSWARSGRMTANPSHTSLSLMRSAPLSTRWQLFWHALSSTTCPVYSTLDNMNTCTHLSKDSDPYDRLPCPMPVHFVLRWSLTSQSKRITSLTEEGGETTDSGP
ncbi:MAG: hypothetical protein J3Q66DRAFT_127290 [Benniella sp.]|nr:MAG: hypothetical protein J3Q66DRAFT_127290 [Benniella sp.]